MFRFWTKRTPPAKAPACPRSRRAQLQVEALETRAVPAALSHVAIPTEQVSTGDVGGFSWGESQLWSWGEHTPRIDAR